MATRMSDQTDAVCKVDRNFRKKDGFRSTPQFLAIIDFGTTYCSVAYLFRPDVAPNPNELDPILLKLDNAGNKRVPCCILFDPHGKKIAFGSQARKQYAALDHKERPQYHYFEYVKKHLQHKKVTIYL